MCPGLSYPAPSSPPMPSTSAEGHHVLTGGASWGLGIGLGTRWEGPSRQCGTGLGTTLRLTRETIPILSPSLSSFSPAASFPSFPRTSLPAPPLPDLPRHCPDLLSVPACPVPRGAKVPRPISCHLVFGSDRVVSLHGTAKGTHSRDHSPGHSGGHGG